MVFSEQYGGPRKASVSCYHGGTSPGRGQQPILQRVQVRYILTQDAESQELNGMQGLVTVRDCERHNEMGHDQELVQGPRMTKHPLQEAVGCYKRTGPCCRRKGRSRDLVTHTGMELNDFSLKGSSEQSLKNLVATSLPQEAQWPAWDWDCG